MSWVVEDPSGSLLNGSVPNSISTRSVNPSKSVSTAVAIGAQGELGGVAQPVVVGVGETRVEPLLDFEGC